MNSVLFWRVLSCSHSNREVKHKVITLAHTRMQDKHQVLFLTSPNEKISELQISTWHAHTTAARNQLVEHPICFLFNGGTATSQPSLQKTPARACRRQLPYLSCSIGTFTWAEVVGSPPPVCHRGARTYVSRAGRCQIQDKRRFRVWVCCHL